MFNLFKKKETENSTDELSNKLKGSPTENIQHSGDFTEDGREIHYYHQDTLHGMHYTEEVFYAEAEKRFNNFRESYPHLAADQEMVSYVMATFRDWNNPDEQRMSHFMDLYDKKISGYVKVESENDFPKTPEWQPIHGIGLKDYAQAVRLSMNNISDDEICKALQIELPIWDEVRTTWNNRFQTSSDSLFDAYIRFQGQPIEHSGLQALSTNTVSATGEDYVALLMTDDFFWAEINAIMMAANNYGVDAMQYIFDNYQITASDYSDSCMAFAERNPGFPPDEVMQYQDEKTEEYNQLFAQGTGGNVADDVSF